MAATLGVALCVVGVAFLGEVSAGRAAREMIDVRWPLAETASDLKIAALDLSADVTQYQATRDAAFRHACEVDRRRFLDALARFDRLADTPRLRASGRRLRGLFDELSTRAVVLMDGDTREHAAARDRGFVAQRRAIIALLDGEIQPEIAANWQASGAATRDTMRRAARLTTVLVPLMLLVGACSGWWVWRSVASPLARLGAAVSALGGGRLDYRVGLETRDELGALGRALDRMAAQLQHSQSEWGQISRRLDSAQEHERALIAREIHDELGQELTVLKFGLIRLDGACRLSKSPEDCPRIAAVRAELVPLADACIATTRRVASGLRPAVLEELGLAAGVEWQVEEFERRSGIVCEFQRGGGEVAIGPERATACYRVLQEALTNVARHSGADHVLVHLDATPERIEVEVADNGVGLPRDAFERGSLGLRGMRERAAAVDGALTFTREEPTGTRVRLVVPLGRCARAETASLGEDASVGHPQTSRVPAA